MNKSASCHSSPGAAQRLIETLSCSGSAQRWCVYKDFCKLWVNDSVTQILSSASDSSKLYVIKKGLSFPSPLAKLSSMPLGSQVKTCCSTVKKKKRPLSAFICLNSCNCGISKCHSLKLPLVFHFLLFSVFQGQLTVNAAC